jgi:hypothetical protein
LKKIVGSLKFPIKSQEEMAEKMNISRRTLFNWGQLGGQDGCEEAIENII